MQLPLADLLKTREVVHPTRLVRLDSQGRGGFSLETEGFMWWLSEPPEDREGRIRFNFEGVDGVIDPSIFIGDPDGEFLEALEARPLSELPWAKGVDCHLFCNSPIEQPLQIYAALHDFLTSVDCPFPPNYYFNLHRDSSLEFFIELTSSPSFLLLRSPESVCGVVIAELERCGTKYTLLRGKSPSDQRVWVRLGNSQIICSSAYAEFEEDA